MFERPIGQIDNGIRRMTQPGRAQFGQVFKSRGSPYTVSGSLIYSGPAGTLSIDITFSDPNSPTGGPLPLWTHGTSIGVGDSPSPITHQWQLGNNIPDILPGDVVVDARISVAYLGDSGSRVNRDYTSVYSIGTIGR